MIDQLSSTPGVRAVGVFLTDQEPAYRGDPDWRSTVTNVLRVHLDARDAELRDPGALDDDDPETSTRTTLGASTVISLHIAGKGAVVAVMPTGHPVLKSWRRMVRRKLAPKRRARAARTTAATEEI